MFMKQIIHKYLKEYSNRNLNEGSKRVKLHPRTLSDLKYVAGKVWNAHLKKDDEQPIKGDIMVVDSAGDYANIPVYYMADLPYQGGVFNLKRNRPRNLYNIFIVLNPEESKIPSLKSTEQILYHEIQHLMDLSTTSHVNKKEEMSYSGDVENEEKYWGHMYEFRAYSNEILQGIVDEYTKLMGKIDDDKLDKSLNSLIDYFGKGGEADEIVQQVLYSITDEIPTETKIPHSLNVLFLLKKYNPKKWNTFLKMLYSTVEELKTTLKQKDEVIESFKKPRKYGESYCKKTPCKNMGFSQKASCRPYKNCYN
jgi:hypothetical protein